MNEKQKAALLALADAFSEAIREANPGHIIPVRMAVGALREAFAEPEPPKRPTYPQTDPMKAAEECQCGTTPEHDMYSQGTDYYVFCPNAECDAQTPNQKTLEIAVRVWNAMQRAAKEEGR